MTAASKPVPAKCLCGEEPWVWRGNSYEGPYHYVECGSCERKAGKRKTHTLAVSAWNNAVRENVQ